MFMALSGPYPDFLLLHLNYLTLFPWVSHLVGVFSVFGCLLVVAIPALATPRICVQCFSLLSLLARKKLTFGFF